MIDDKSRYQMSSSATKKLAERINRFSPMKPSSDQMNDEKVIGKHTPSISEKTIKVTEDSQFPLQAHSEEAEIRMPSYPLAFG